MAHEDCAAVANKDKDHVFSEWPVSKPKNWTKIPGLAVQFASWEDVEDYYESLQEIPFEGNCL